MDDAELQRLWELCDRATPGPWCVSAHDDRDYPTMDVWYEGRNVAEDVVPDDAGFIAAARTALPALVDELARARAVLEHLSPELLRRARARVGLDCTSCTYCDDLGRCSAGARCIPADDAAALEAAAQEMER